MTEDERMLVLMAKADEALAEAGLDGVMIVGTWRAADGDTCDGNVVRGNRHAATGAANFVLRQQGAYEDGFNAEKGRYDSVTIRQRHQQRKDT